MCFYVLTLYVLSPIGFNLQLAIASDKSCQQTKFHTLLIVEKAYSVLSQALVLSSLFLAAPDKFFTLPAFFVSLQGKNKSEKSLGQSPYSLIPHKGRNYQISIVQDISTKSCLRLLVTQ